jgi:ribosome assembly protein 1
MIPVKVNELSKQDLAMVNAQRLAKHQAQQAAAAASGETNNEDPFTMVDVTLKPDQEIFLALGRIFSGHLTRSSDLYIIGHKYNPQELFTSTPTAEEIDSILNSNPDYKHMITHVPRKAIDEDKIGCYIMLGPSIYPAESVPAGNIVGIIGLEDFILKTATVGNTPFLHPLKSITFQAKPMLKVAVEPTSHQDLKKIATGLNLLYQFDPVVEIGIDDSGQYTMTCLGELHLDQCVKALVDKFAK